MKTTLDLPDELVHEAMRLVKLKTPSDVVVLALQELIKTNRLPDLKRYKGQVDINLDLDVLRDRHERPG